MREGVGVVRHYWGWSILVIFLGLILDRGKKIFVIVLETILNTRELRLKGLFKACAP